VFRYAGGVPRLVNVLCDTALLCAFAEERTVIDEALVKAAVEELQWVEYSERPERLRETAPADTGRFRAASDQPLARLEVLYRDQLVGEYRIGFGKTIIGRTEDNDVQIKSRFISRHHAQVVSDHARSVVEDLNSTNGVFIRSQRVKQHALADGDIIQLGEHKLLYRDMRAAQPQRLLVADDDDEDDLDDFDEDEDADEDEDESDDGDLEEGDGDDLQEERQVDERRR
jgi:hypothetical protein